MPDSSFGNSGDISRVSASRLRLVASRKVKGRDDCVLFLFCSYRLLLSGIMANGCRRCL